MRRLLVRVAGPIILLASINWVLPRPGAAADLNPPPPPDARCATNSHSTICTFSFTAPPESGASSGVICPGFEVLENSLVSVDVRRTYDQNGNLVEVKRHLKQPLKNNENIWYNSTDPRKAALQGGNWIVTFTLTTPGDLSTAVTAAITGDQSRVKLPGDGVILQDAGRLTYDPNGDLTFEAGNHMLTDGDTARVCAALA
jgi:hypothetical protein